MADIALSITVSRTLLGLPPLEIGYNEDYYVAAEFLGGQVTWQRTKITSPWVDGEVTTQRFRLNPTETIGVEIVAETQQQLDLGTEEVLAAFLQDNFVLTVTVDGGQYSYACEAADYTAAQWTTPRLTAKQGQILFSLPRQPVQLSGAI